MDINGGKKTFPIKDILWNKSVVTIIYKLDEENENIKFEDMVRMMAAIRNDWLFAWSMLV